jgi:hypothetical protein
VEPDVLDWLGTTVCPSGLRLRKVKPRNPFRRGKERSSPLTYFNLGLQSRTTPAKLQTQNLHNANQKVGGLIGRYHFAGNMAGVRGRSDGLGRGLLALLSVPYQVLTETACNLFFFAFSKLLFDFIKSEVHYIVVMQFFGPYEIA